MLVRCHLLNQEHQALQQLDVYDGGMEAQVNMPCCILDALDREIVAAVQRVLS